MKCWGCEAITKSDAKYEVVKKGIWAWGGNDIHCANPNSCKLLNK